MQSSILENAIESIQVGLEDYQMGTRPRLVSSVRNLFAGILLLFKHKLVLMSPEDSKEALIKKKVLPVVNGDGTVSWEGKGNVTIDVQDIIDRFKSLGITVEKQRLTEIQKKRNDLEHYYLKDLTNEAVKGMLSNTFLLIRDFCKDQLDVDAGTLLGEDAWKILTEISEVYEKEKAECLTSFQQCDLPPEIIEGLLEEPCPKCGVSLKMFSKDNGEHFSCKSCDVITFYADMVEQTMTSMNYRTQYESKGMDTDVIICPSCQKQTYLVGENYCVICKESYSNECVDCGSMIDPEELNEDSLCGWCSHMRVSRERD